MTVLRLLSVLVSCADTPKSAGQKPPSLDLAESSDDTTKHTQLDVSVVGQKQVSALDVAMHLPGGVQVVEALQRLFHHGLDLAL